MTFTDIFGYLLAVASAVTIMPQAYHLLATKKTQGLSFSMSIMGVTTMCFWSFYTYNIKDWPAFASSILPLIIWLLIFLGIALLSNNLSRKHLLPPFLLWSVIAVLTLSPLLKLYGIVAAFCSCLWALPQLYKIIKESHFAGVSFLAFFALGVENLCWVIYALLRGNPTYLYAPIIQGPAAFYIAFIVYRYQQSNKAVTKI